MLQDPRFICEINPKSKIQNPKCFKTPDLFVKLIQNPKSKIQNPKLDDF
ncbi:hypothetical protein NSP_21160 [Nodularia spumigena CCY9414]|nr:hypothetical protein NSP_21160 [Nodularia spumigena CCY9414]EAW43673.1 hypothetical protein N9414_15352 [Nodularia spumigena CCY9414]